MPALGKFSAWIAVDDLPLTEYDPQVNLTDSTVTCWIASEAGKEFVPCWKDSHNDRTIGGYVELDGTKCGGAVCLYKGTPSEVIARRRYIAASETTVKPFVFADADLTEDDRYLQESKSLNIGEIKIRIFECEVGEPCSPDLSISLSESKIHERSKKGLGHRIQAGKERVGTFRQYHETRLGKRLATFIYRYRPLAMLQAQGIAPLERDNKRPRDQQEEDDDEREEREVAKELEEAVYAAKVAQLEAELRTLKESSPRKRQRIKTEPSPDPLEYIDPNPVVVDLTLDSD